uniref:F-box/LRR-repeat protein 15-like leucin rich repeat domain-containing protein n=1 Tax=Lutzomyia longipalpis TaxID=7200 RepID=A0A1B0GGS1_LUTLO
MAGRKVVTVCSWQISRDIDEVLPALHVLAESCKNIQKIHLIDIWWMKDELLQRFLANNTNLEVIDLLGCGDITEKGFQAISKDCPKLKSLMVENTRFSNAGLDAFRLHNNNLIEVNFSQCNFSTTCLNAFFCESTSP